MKTILPDNEKAVLILKRKGPQPISMIAHELDVTTEGARFHLLKLEKDGLVKSMSVAEGRGRPKQIWSLTKAGHNRFPDAHAGLTVNLINMMRESLGEDAVDKVIKNHEERMLARYSEEIDDNLDLESKISELVEIRTYEGYMAEYEKDENGYLLIENHCPICSAAKICQGFCRAEIQTFRKVLGEDLKIERVEHIIAGERRCAYRISKP